MKWPRCKAAAVADSVRFDLTNLATANDFDTTSVFVPGSPARAGVNKTVTAFDIGANVNMAGFGLTGYYGEGRGLGTGLQFSKGFDGEGEKRKSEDWYVQGTYTLPGVGTKLGVSYGESQLKYTEFDDNDRNYNNSMWTFGAYHPITKHLNLVAEYSEQQLKDEKCGTGDYNGKSKTVSLGAILFF